MSEVWPSLIGEAEVVLGGGFRTYPVALWGQQGGGAGGAGRGTLRGVPTDTGIFDGTSH